MKKLITITTLLAAGAALANAETITLPESSDFTWIPGNSSGIGNGATTDVIMKSLIDAMGDDTIGWFGGTGQGYGSGSSYGSDISISSSMSFSFTSRPSLSGEYVALGVALDKVAESITLNFSTDNKLGYSLWAYDSTAKTATELIPQDTPVSESSVSQTYSAASVDADRLFVVWTANYSSKHHAGGGNKVNVSGISLSYIAIPEPSAFGLLAGLGALALAGTRRRRRK